MPRVLLCARRAALELGAIAGALGDRGAEPVVLDPSAFPNHLAMTLAYAGAGLRGGWGSDAQATELDGISAVWHSAAAGTELPAMEPGVRETCVAASELAIAGLLEGLQVFQLDPYWTKARADCKPLQLRIAQQVGLDIPETLVSHDPRAVRAFAGRAGPVVGKLLVQPGSTGPAGGEADVMFTTAMTPADLAELGGLELCPMIFQERIENRRDVRVTIAGHRLFSVALDAAARGGGEVDWRRDSYALDRVPVWAPYELPRVVADRVLRLLDRLGLNYAAVDLVVRPDGRHVFLELNASGSFGFLGADHAGAIAGAIADVLIDPAARRVPGPA